MKPTVPLPFELDEATREVLEQLALMRGLTPEEALIEALDRYILREKGMLN
jgi:hypothetical protein